jgi:ankyrin repeat protein
MINSFRKTLIFSLLILIQIFFSHTVRGNTKRNIDFVDAVILRDHEKVKSELKAGIRPDVIKDSQSKKTGIMYASEAGDLKMIKILISYRANLNRRDPKGNTPLIYAVGKNRLKAAEMLIKNGASPNTGNMMGETPLEKASREGNGEMVRLLLDNRGMAGSGLALIAASRYGFTNIVKLLLKKNPPVTIKGREGMTALAAAVLGGHYEIVELLLKQGSDVNMIQRHSRTPVMIAAGNGDLKMVKFLAGRRADMNRITRGNNCPLYEAIKSNIYSMVKLVLDLKARVKIRDRNLETPLMHCAKMDATPDSEIAKLLLEKNADLNRRNRQGKTALMFAAEKGHTEIVKLLVEKGATLNDRDRKRKSAADYASISGHTDILNFLLEKGAGKPVAKIKKEKKSAPLIKSETVLLHKAAALSNLSMMKQLIENGTDINATDSSGSTPLISALKSGAPEKKLLETVKFLLEHHADPDIHDSNNMSALDYASRENLYKVVKMLIMSDVKVKGLDLFLCAMKNGDITFAHYLAKSERFDIDSALFATDNYKAVKLLIECGANVNTRNSKKLTPLLYFSRQRKNWGYYRNIQIIDELVKAGADIHAADSRGKTALAYAKSARNRIFVEFLTSKGAVK